MRNGKNFRINSNIAFANKEDQVPFVLLQGLFGFQGYWLWKAF